ncbi:MAG: hypothetical protein ABJB85_12155 [Nitrososphaerota archaeon]
MLAVQIIDETIGGLADILKDFATSNQGITLFISIVAIYGFGQYFILEMVKARNKEQQIKILHFNIIEKIVTVVQYILTAIMVSVVFQIIFLSQYYTIVLNMGITISGGLAIYLLGAFTYWFLSWFKRTRSFLLLLFGLAMAFTSISIVAMIVLFNGVWLQKPDIITPNSEVVFTPGPQLQQLVNTVQTNTGIASFILVWAGTVIVLRHNIHRIGTVKFWVLLSTPIIIFSSSYFSLYQYLAGTVPQAQSNNPMFSIALPFLLIIFSGVTAAALIGIAFRSIAKPLSEDTLIKGYMIITSYGFILFFTTTLTSAAVGYPPFGFVNVLLVGPFSFIILNGLYRSTISVAQDSKLRKSIKDTTKNELKLLHDMGTAKMYKDIERKVTKVLRTNADLLTEQSGIKPSLTDEEVREYLALLIRETKKKNEA